MDPGGKTPRYYQRVAINRTVEKVVGGQDRLLLVMATGTGKTTLMRAVEGYLDERPDLSLRSTVVRLHANIVGWELAFLRWEVRTRERLENARPRDQADSATSSRVSGGAWASGSGSWAGSSRLLRIARAEPKSRMN